MVFGALTALAKKLGEFNSQVMLSVVYVLGVGLTSFVAKIFRKKFLPLDQKTQSSYWIEHKEEESMKSFKRSF
jgi:cytochrome c biogenesis protein CcdA